MEIKCLDKGFVRLVETMGCDSSVVQAARVSYGEGTKTVHQDRELLRYLLRHDHSSPFEMVEIKLHCKLPLFVARQWIRHRTANVNEISGRYSIMQEEFYIPNIEDIQFQSKKNHQGRDEENCLPKEVAGTIRNEFNKASQNIYGLYKEMLDENVAKEISRMILPLNLYTEWYWKIDLSNLFRFLRLRLDGHAQKEIRVYAKAIAKIVQNEFPLCFEAFEDYQLNAVKFSRLEMEIIKKLIDKEKFPEKIKDMGKFEYREFYEKLFTSSSYPPPQPQQQNLFVESDRI